MSDLSKLQKQLEKLVRDGAASGKIASIAERILVLSPSNITALHTKAVSCMHQEKFGAALSALERLERIVYTDFNRSRRGKQEEEVTVANGFDAVTFYFHKAYCLYRMQQYSEVKANLCKQQNLCPSNDATRSGDSIAAISHIPSRHLLAQTLYHLEEYRSAAEVYASLLAENEIAGVSMSAEERSELWINYSAALAGCDAEAALRTIVMALDGPGVSDVWYNGAVAQLEGKSNDSNDGSSSGSNSMIRRSVQNSSNPLQGVRITDSVALELLRRAEGACAIHHPNSRVVSLQQVCTLQHEEAKMQTDNDTTDAAATTRASLIQRMAAPLPGQPTTAERLFFNDVVNIWVQTAYAYHQLSIQARASTNNSSRNVSQACQLQYNSRANAIAILRLVLSLKPNSPITTAVASVNWTALRGEKDLFDSLRRLNAAQQARIQKRLTRAQNAAVLYNTALLHLYRNSLVQFKATVEQMMRDFADYPLTHTLQLILSLREGRRRCTATVTNATSAVSNRHNTHDDNSNDKPSKGKNATSVEEGEDKNGCEDDNSNRTNSRRKSRSQGDSEADSAVALIRECVSRYECALAHSAEAQSQSRVGPSYESGTATMLNSLAIPPSLIAAQLYLDYGELAQAVQSFATALALHGRSRTQPAALATMLAWRTEMGEAKLALAELGHAIANSTSISVSATSSSNAMSMTMALELTVWAVQYIMSVVESCPGSSSNCKGSSHASDNHNNSMDGIDETYDGNTLTRAVIAMLQHVREAVPALRSNMSLSALLVQCLTRIDCAAAAGEAERAGLTASSSISASRSSAVGVKSKDGKSAVGTGAATEYGVAIEEGPSRAVLEALRFHRPAQTANLSSSGTNNNSSTSTAGQVPGEERALQRRRRARVMRRPPRNKDAISGKPDPERWLPMSVRSYIKDLPERRKKELRRLRALEQEQKRRAVEKTRAAEAAASTQTVAA